MDENKLFDLAELYSVGEVAAGLHVSKSSVYRWVEGGKLGFFRFGENGSIRVAGAHLETFLSEYGSDVDHEREELGASGFYDDEA